VVLAAQAGGGFADLLDGGQEQSNQDGDDGDHHQQLDQREPSRSRRVLPWHDGSSLPSSRGGIRDGADCQQSTIILTSSFAVVKIKGAPPEVRPREGATVIPWSGRRS